MVPTSYDQKGKRHFLHSVSAHRPASVGYSFLYIVLQGSSRTDLDGDVADADEVDVDVVDVVDVVVVVVVVVVDVVVVDVDEVVDVTSFSALSRRS